MQAYSITDEQMLTEYMEQHYSGKIVVELSFYSAFDDGGSIAKWLEAKLGEYPDYLDLGKDNLNVFIVCESIEEARELAASSDCAGIWNNGKWEDEDDT